MEWLVAHKHSHTHKHTHIKGYFVDQIMLTPPNSVGFTWLHCPTTLWSTLPGSQASSVPRASLQFPQTHSGNLIYYSNHSFKIRTLELNYCVVRKSKHLATRDISKSKWISHKKFPVSLQDFGPRKAGRRVQPGGLQPRLHAAQVCCPSGVRWQWWTIAGAREL